MFLSSVTLFMMGPEFIQFRYIGNKTIAEKGAMGDAFGGTLAPIIAWIASILTFMAFYIQYEANKEQRKQFEKQANDTVIERFENRFFELIRLHRENVEEQNIQNKIFGRKAFTTYYFELRYIYVLLEYNYDQFPSTIKLNKEQLTNLAYLIFFFGIGHVTDSVFSHIMPQVNCELFFKNTLNRLQKEKETYSECIKNREKYEAKFNVRNVKLKDLVIEHRNKKAIFIQLYEPFTGHGTKIGHYYRHLFQTVKYVHEQENKLFDDDLKYSYIKILRAQLSNFEQVILYYNSISVLGNAWITNEYIKNYHLITNLPLSFADFGITPKEKFEEIIKTDPEFFDWQILKSSFI